MTDSEMKRPIQTCGQARSSGETKHPEGDTVNIGPTELLVILAIVLLVFGSTRLPKLARSMGQASKEFHHGAHEGLSDPTSDN
jgi:sec-independent protein translocase protein TatA